MTETLAQERPDLGASLLISTAACSALLLQQRRAGIGQNVGVGVANARKGWTELAHTDG